MISRVGDGLRRALGHRLLHFVALGGLLFVLAPPERDDRAITIEADRVEAKLRSIRARLGRPISAEEQHAAVRELVDEEVLAREALRLGVGVADPIVRARLADQMRETLASTLPPVDVGEDEIARESARRAREASPRVRLEVHFFRKERPDAQSAAERFRERRDGDDRAPIPDGAWWTEDMLARVAGAGVARAAMTTPIGEPSAPTTSSWGIWVVVPLERRPASPEELRGEAIDLLSKQRRARSIEQLVERSRRDYRVDVRPHAGEPLDRGERGSID